MKMLTNYFFKNWFPILLFALLAGGWAWVKIKDNKIAELEITLAKAQGDNERLASASLSQQRALAAAQGVFQQAQGDKKQDSIFFAKQLTGMQSVIAQVRVKAKREKEADDALIVELRKGLPPKECYNLWGKVVDCKD
jgi:hypothetical protein